MKEEHLWIETKFCIYYTSAELKSPFVYVSAIQDGTPYIDYSLKYSCPFSFPFLHHPKPFPLIWVASQRSVQKETGETNLRIGIRINFLVDFPRRLSPLFPAPYVKIFISALMVQRT